MRNETAYMDGMYDKIKFFEVEVRIHCFAVAILFYYFIYLACAEIYSTIAWDTEGGKK